MLRRILDLFGASDQTSEGNKWLCVATCSSEAEAAILTGKLESVGIRCTLRKFGDMLAGDVTTA